MKSRLATSLGAKRLLLVFLLVIGAHPQVLQAQDALPRLPAGAHLGMLIGFDPLNGNQSAKVATLWRDARNQGMDVARLQVDWSGLEPSPGVFDGSDLIEALKPLKRQDLKVMLTLSTADSFELTLPADLINDDGSDFAPGLGFGHPVVLARWQALLEWLVPFLRENGVFALSVANEPDALMDPSPHLKTGFTDFIALAQSTLNTLGPDIPVGVTLTTEVFDTDPAFARAVTAVSDVLMFNVYCVGGQSPAQMQTLLNKNLDEILGLDPAKPLLIQEAGCPAGYDDQPSFLGNTANNQSAFYDLLVNAMKTRPRLRAAFAFQLHDWSPALAQTLVDSLNALGDFSHQTVEQFREYWRTIGLCKWPDMQCRPAWSQFLQGVHDLSTPAPLAAVLPQARAVKQGDTATTFAVLVNASGHDFTHCAPALPKALAGIIDFSYQSVTPQNTLTGTPNTPVDLAAGQSQNFVMALTPGQTMSNQDIAFVFSCSNARRAATYAGVNTFVLTANASSPADLLAINASLKPGVLEVTANGAAFAVAAINLGLDDTITVRPDDGGSGLPLHFTICPTDPANGACQSPPAAQISFASANQQTHTFSVFASPATGIIIDDPVLNRVFVRFTDPNGRLVGATSLAVHTTP